MYIGYYRFLFIEDLVLSANTIESLSDPFPFVNQEYKVITFFIRFLGQLNAAICDGIRKHDSTFLRDFINFGNQESIIQFSDMLNTQMESFIFDLVSTLTPNDDLSYLHPPCSISKDKNIIRDI